jgi:hypothetical protein
LRWVKTEWQATYPQTMSGPFIFRCPVTSQNIQGSLDDDDNARDDEYEAVACPACARLHFFNRKTGKMLGHESE